MPAAAQRSRSSSTELAVIAHDRYTPACRLAAADFGGGLITIHSRHLAVHEDRVKAGDHLQRGRPPARDRRLSE